MCADDARTDGPPEQGREYSAGSSSAPPTGGTADARADGPGSAERASGARTDPLLDSATDHAAARRHRAVLRTPLRAPVRSPLPGPPPARPAPAPDRARDGGASACAARPDARAEPLRRPPQPGRPRRVRRHDRRPSPRSWPTARSSFARAHHYTLVDRPRVDAARRPGVERADIRVDARFADPIAGHVGHGDRRRRRRRPTARPSVADADRHDGLHGPATRRAPRARPARDPTRDGASASIEVDGRPADASAGRPTTTSSSPTAGCRAITAGSAGAAGRSSTRTSAARTARGSTAYRSTEVVLGVGDRIELGDTVLVVEVGSGQRRLMDGFLLVTVGRPAPVPRPALPVPVPGRPGAAARPARRGPRADRPSSGGWSSLASPSGRAAGRAGRSRSTRSRRSGATSTTRSSSTTRSRRPSTPS